MNNDGMSLRRYFTNFYDFKHFIDRCCRAGILRCTSPERSELCNNAATHVFWNDRAEWYPCCEEHRIGGEQWTGSTDFSAYKIELLVIPDLAQQWLESLSGEEQAEIEVLSYERSG